MFPDVLVYVCRNCFAHTNRLPRQWEQEGIQVHLREIPCSGKIDTQYLFHALEGGVRGICVVACPQGECRLAEGNYRAEVRIQTVHKLLVEIGVEPERIELLRSSSEDRPEELLPFVREAAQRISALGPNPAGAKTGRLEKENV